MQVDATEQAEILAVARLAGIELAAAGLAGVIQYHRLLRGFADQLTAFELDESCADAAVFTPCSPVTPAR